MKNLNLDLTKKIQETEHIKNAIYTAQNQHKLVLSGDANYDEARNMILKFMNFGLEKGKQHDVIKYFKNEVSGSGEIMKDEILRDQSKKEAWEALEYFDII